MSQAEIYGFRIVDCRPYMAERRAQAERRAEKAMRSRLKRQARKRKQAKKERRQKKRIGAIEANEFWNSFGLKEKKVVKAEIETRKIKHTPPARWAIRTAKVLRKKYGKSFYSSVSWVLLKKEVFGFYGTACMRCGLTEKEARKEKIKIDVDHILSRKKHPKLELDFYNMQVLCRDCNHDKGWKDETDYRPLKIKKELDMRRIQ